MTRRNPFGLAVVSTIAKTIEGCPWYQEIRGNRDRILRLAAQLEQGVEHAGRPLRILITGGTGVGKSTLLNALASADIATSGPLRPTTRQFTVYQHESDDDPWIESLTHVEHVYHQREPLRHKIIIDAPDADSAVVENRTVLQKAIELTDIVLVVVTEEKYVSDAVMTLLSANRRGHRFAFVINKSDLGYEDDVLKDLKTAVEQTDIVADRFFVLSALESFRQRTAGLDLSPDSEFGAFESYLALVLDEVKIREIKRMNLQERAGMLADCLETSLPEGYRDAAAKWLSACDLETNRFLTELGSIIGHRVLDTETLARRLVVHRASRFSGPFGMMTRVIYFFQKMTQPGFFKNSENLSNAVMEQLDNQSRQTLLSGVTVLRNACITRSREAGLQSDAVERSLAKYSDTELDRPEEWVGRQLMDTMRVFLMSSTPRANGLISLILNLPVWIWMSYWAYRLIVPVFSPETMPLQSIPGAFILLVLGMLLEWSVVDKIHQWLARIKARKLISWTITEVNNRFRAAFSPAIERTATDISTCTQQLAAAVDDLKNAAGTALKTRNPD